MTSEIRMNEQRNKYGLEVALNNALLATWYDEHWYKIGDDKYIASVTTKLSVESKGFIARWRGDIGNREADLRMNEASQRGVRIHKALSIYHSGGKIIYDNWRNPSFTESAIKEMEKRENVFILRNQDEMVDLWKVTRALDVLKAKIIDYEYTVYSIEDDIAGTLDMSLEIKKGFYEVGSKNGLNIPETGIYIADLKTGKTFDESMWRQIAPYAHCYKKMGRGEAVGGLIFHTGSSNKGIIPGLSIKICPQKELDIYLQDYFHLASIWDRNNKNSGPEIFSFPSIIQKEKI